MISAARLFAAAPVYSNNFAAVTLDGVRLGTDTDPSNYSMFPSVVYDPQSGLFHMWVAATSTLSIEGLRHATSADGVHFISDGNLSFAGGSPFPIYGAPVEPQFEFPRAAKIGTDWKLLIWTENGAPGQFGDYNYNESVNDIGVDPSTLAVAHQGPVYPTNGAGTFGQTTGPFGFIDGKLYVADDRPGGISKWTYDDTTPPSVTTPADMSQDLIMGTGYVYFLTHPGDPLGVYVHNVGRVLDQGDGTLGVYYSLRHPDGSRVNQQIYYAQSGDNGQSWSAPVGIFGSGEAVRVDGTPNTFELLAPRDDPRRLAARPLLLDEGGRRRVRRRHERRAGPPSDSWADLLGSGQGAGETGVAIARTADGGFAILSRLADSCLTARVSGWFASTNRATSSGKGLYTLRLRAQTATPSDGLPVGRWRLCRRRLRPLPAAYPIWLVRTIPRPTSSGRRPTPPVIGLGIRSMRSSEPPTADLLLHRARMRPSRDRASAGRSANGSLQVASRVSRLRVG